MEFDVFFILLRFGLDTVPVSTYIVNQYSQYVDLDMRAKKQRTAIRQKVIAEEALGMIATHGLPGVSIADLAQKVGLVPSGIYRHFKGKEEILESVFDLIGERFYAIVNEVSQATPDPLERLGRVLRLHLDLIQKSPAIPRIVFSEGIFSENDHRRTRVLQIVEGYLEKVAEIICLGQREGRIRSDVEPKTVAVMFLGLIQPLIILSHATDGKFDVSRHVQQAWPLFLELIQRSPRCSGSAREST